MNVDIRNAQPVDFHEVFQLLRMVDLPVEGVIEHFSNFLVAVTTESSITALKVIGCVGLEIYGKSALLRSLAIHPSYQGHGLGRSLVEAITKKAQIRNIHQLFLLTDSAVTFFHKLGFRNIDKDQIPEDVKQSVEFTTLCPSAPCLSKEI